MLSQDFQFIAKSPLPYKVAVTGSVDKDIGNFTTP